MRFHLLGMAHLPQSEEFVACAFSMKNRKLAKMLTSLGHTVFFYGSEGSDVEQYCKGQPGQLVFIQTHTLDDIRRDYGDGDLNFTCGYDHKSGGFRNDFNAARKPSTKKFIKTAIEEINKTKRDDDFLLLSMGTYHKPVADGVNLFLTCEPGIGYRGSWARFRAFESSYIMNFTYGSEHPRQSINGSYYDRVIPNYWDGEDFTFSGQPEDYYFFIGRMILRKGVWTAVKATQELGARLILAGQADREIDHTKLPPHCEFIGHVDAVQRNKLLGGALASFVPTTYLEPFGGVTIEANLTGTPAISTNFGVFPETVHNGLNGYRCDTLDDFVWAAQEAPKLDRRVIRKHAERYLLEQVRWDFAKWFDDLYCLYESARKPGVKGWHRIRERNPEWRKKIIFRPK